MKTFFRISICIFLLAIPGFSQAQKFRTETLSSDVKTLRVNIVDQWNASPIIVLEGNELVEINFDVMGATPERYIYSIIHCNADWKPSQLIQSEYMNGFQNRIIDDYAISFNTTTDYVNYRVTFPNEDTYLKVSGNYVVQISPESGGKPILNACFSVVDNDANISMQVSSLTDKGMNSYYQQVNFEVTGGERVRTPMQELKVYVQQNNRTDNEAALVKPLSVQGNKLIYQHNPNLIFDGGNEYRSFEMTTVRHNGLNIENIEFHAPYYHVILKPDGMRSNRTYSYTEDINGRFYIRSLTGTDFDYESDYRIVHFYLPCEKPFNQDVYILSNAFNNIFDQRSKMEYNAVEKGYTKSVLLKEGYYNYLYVTRKDNNSPANPTLIEGNYYETENEYRVLVYYRPIGGRYDQLIGTKTVQFK